MGRRQRNRRYISLLVLLLLSLLIGGFLVIERNARPIIMTIAKAKAKILAVQAINTAINKEIAATARYQDLVTIHKDVKGKVVLLQPNTAEISQMLATTSTSIQGQLEAMMEQEISIPVGQITGSTLLANLGPRVKVSIVPLGTVSVNIVDGFKDAGINQTLHQLILEVEAKVQVVIPLAQSTTSVVTSVPLTQTVIVGEVPQHYWQLYRQDSSIK